MGKRGPQPQPTQLKIARGNPGNRPLPTNEVAYNQEPPAEPEFLNEIGLACYREMVVCCESIPDMLQRPDYQAIALYSEAYQEFRQAMVSIAERGADLVSEKGNQYTNPAVGRKNKAAERMMKIAAKFGWTPGDRVGLNLPHDKPEADDDFAAHQRRSRA